MKEGDKVMIEGVYQGTGFGKNGDDHMLLLPSGFSIFFNDCDIKKEIAQEPVKLKVGDKVRVIGDEEIFEITEILYPNAYGDADICLCCAKEAVKLLSEVKDV